MTQFHLADLFESVAHVVPDRLASVDDNRNVTYAQMNHRADALAVGLYKQGVRRGDKIGLYLTNCPEYLESFFACVKLGAVPFNVNYRYQLEELTYLFGNADAVAVIHGAEFSFLVDEIKSALPKLKLSIAFKDGQGISSTSSADYESLFNPDVTGAIFDRSEDDYLLQYTGGTTGAPKGVMWPHKAFFMACLGGGGLYARKPPISKPAEQASLAKESYPIRILPVAPLMHGAAIWTALSGILGGMTLVLDPMRGGFSAENIWDRVEKQHVNILQIVGDAMAVPLFEALQKNPERWDLSRLIHFGSGGAVFSQHVKDALNIQLPNVMIVDGMGASETGISGIGEPSSGEGFMRLPSNECQQVIVDARIGGVGETGYLARKGYIPIGYYNDPKKISRGLSKD